MPNTFITAQNVSKAALGYWQYNNVLASLFNRAYENEFGGGKGSTISIRKQASLIAKKFDRATGLEIQDIVEDKITVTVEDLFDVSVLITQEQWDFDIFDFNWEVAEPAGRALSKHADVLIADALTAHSAAVPITTARPYDGIVDARAVLNQNEAPLEDRFVVVGSEVAGAILKSDQFLKVDQSGDNGALREARIGRIAMMNVFESVRVPADEAYVCHRDALTFVSIVPQLPRGASAGALATHDNLGLRTVFGYDLNTKQDLISFDSYYEVAPLRGEALPDPDPAQKNPNGGFVKLKLP